MSKNEFDELLLKKLQEEELEYNPAHWDRLAQLLPPTLAPAPADKGKKWTIATGIAAAIALALATVFLVKLLNQPSAEKTGQPPVAKKAEQPGDTPQPAPHTAVQQPSLAQSSPQTIRPASTAAAPSVRSHQQVTIPQPAVANNTAQNIPILQQNPALQPNNNSIQILPGALNPGTVAPKETVADNKVVHEPAPAVQETIPEPRRANANNSAIAKVDVMPSVSDIYAGSTSAFYEGRNGTGSNKKTSISLGGGVNYGNLNTGYTAGVSVRRKVGGDFFVDGSVAMLYNNNANNVAINNGPPLADNTNTAARPTAFNNETTLASPALDPIQKLYYVQFNPSLGYQVEKHVALSVGGDFQQILNSRGEQDEIVQPGTNSSKVFPNFDVGFTAKSEFSITPSIQAGLVYREGLNNMLKNEGSKYVNRRYLQVQFKYNIPVN
jgi:hypothetical protein